MRWIALVLLLFIKVAEATVYKIDVGGEGTSYPNGIYSGMESQLNGLPVTNPESTSTTVWYKPTQGAFILNSNGNPFKIINYLIIDTTQLDQDLFGFPGEVLNSNTIMGPVRTGSVSINEGLFPEIDISKTIFNPMTGISVDVRLVDNYFAGVPLQGLSYMIETIYESGPQNTLTSFGSIILSYEISNMFASSLYNPSVAGFRIEDFNGNAASYLRVIPEPSALSLLAVGLGGLAMMRRRRS
jgi:hypothetical protein